MGYPGPLGDSEWEAIDAEKDPHGLQDLMAESWRLRAESERLLIENRRAIDRLRITTLHIDGLIKERRLKERCPPGGSRLEVKSAGAKRRSPPTDGNRRPDGLSRREREVLECIAQGNSTKEIAARLGISFKTAACYRYRMMEKLAIHDTATLVRYAIRTGIATG